MKWFAVTLFLPAIIWYIYKTNLFYRHHSIFIATNTVQAQSTAPSSTEKPQAEEFFIPTKTQIGFIGFSTAYTELNKKIFMSRGVATTAKANSFSETQVDSGKNLEDKTPTLNELTKWTSFYLDKHKNDFTKINLPPTSATEISQLLNLYLQVSQISKISPETSHLRELIKSELVNRSQETFYEISYSFSETHKFPTSEAQYLTLVAYLNISNEEKYQYLSWIFNQELGDMQRDQHTHENIYLALVFLDGLDITWDKKKALLDLYVSRNRHAPELLLKARSEVELKFPNYFYE